MGIQKKAIVELVASYRDQGRAVDEVLSSAGVARSSYYRWKQGNGEKKAERPSSYELTVEERGLTTRSEGNTPSTAIGAFRECCSSEACIYRHR
jgi:transposase